METVKKDTIKNRENLEKLERALAQLDEDATGVLDAYKQAQVTLSFSSMQFTFEGGHLKVVIEFVRYYEMQLLRLSKF